MKKFFTQFFSQKLLLTLLVGLFLGGCMVDFGTQDSTVDQTIWSNFDKDYYSINIVDGVHDTNTYSSLSFDTDKNMVFITNVIDGTTISKEWYYMELLEERGNTNGAFLLSGNNYGRYNNMYMGVSIFSNQDGSFVRWHMQDREIYTLDITLDIITNHNFASDKMIFRLHKNYLDKTAYEVDENGVAVSGGDSFIATIPNAGEYAFSDNDDNFVINQESTILYVLDDSSIEIMTKSDGDGYIVIEYANDSSKMKMTTLEDSFVISKDNVVSELASAKMYDFDGAPAPTEIADKIFEVMNGQEFTPQETKLSDGEYYYDKDACTVLTLHFGENAITIKDLIGDSVISDIKQEGSFTHKGDNYYYVWFDITGEVFCTITEIGSPSTYKDRDVVLIVKANSLADIDSDTPMLWHYRQTGEYYAYDKSVNSVEYYGGATDWTSTTSGELFDALDTGVLADSFDIQQYFNYNMPKGSTKLFIEYFENDETYNGYKYFSSDQFLLGSVAGYFYNEDGDDDMVGTFGTLSHNNNTKLMATVTLPAGTISVRVMEFIDFFTDEEIYSDVYIYYSSSTSLKDTITGRMYRYTGDGDMATREGTFSSDDDKHIKATIDDDEVITITVIEKLFIDNFVDGTPYNGYTYRASDQSLYYNNEYLTYNNDGGTGTTGTFGQLETSSVDGLPYGIELIAKIVDSTITVTVDFEKPKTTTFMYDDVEYVYSFVSGKVNGDDFLSHHQVGGVWYYWQEVDNKNIYFKVENNADIYGVATEGSTPIKDGVSADLYDGVSVTVRNDAICFAGTGSVDLFNGNVDVKINDSNGSKVSVYGNVNCDLTVQGDLIVYGDLNANGNYVSVTGNLYVYGDLYVSVTGNLYAFSNLYAYGDVEGEPLVFGNTDADENYIYDNFATIASEMALTKLN